ncbi:MAG TPA: hypothetical protein VEZ55_13150 [Chitinophagaceae bacterium]|nr:hypothetical protein [Chitinophagaceae bacterium]
MIAKSSYKNFIWEAEIKQWLQRNKILQNTAMASALYIAVKYEKDIFPFAVNKNGGKMTITYVSEPPSSPLRGCCKAKPALGRQ